jgi:hypothetical protein
MRSFIADRKGAVAVYFALIAPILLGFAALGTEVGFWLLKERKLQHAADSAAYAAAVRSLTVSDPAILENVARQAANLGNSTLVGQPGTNRYTVTITHSTPRQITRIFNRDDPEVTLRVRAVAAVFRGIGDPVCMQALSTDPSSPAISVSGSGNVNIGGCAFATNSPAPDSMSMQGARVRVTGSCLYTVGGVQVTSGLDLLDPDCPVAQTLRPPTPDPYADLALPNNFDVAGLSLRANGASMTPNEFMQNHPGLGVARFSSLTLQGNVNLTAGLYIVDGGEFRINSNAIVNGTGVSFYLMNGARLVVTGTPQLNISAYDPSNPGLRTDDFAGLLFFADRHDAPTAHSFAGTSNSNINGVFYFPNDSLTFTGDTGTASPCFQMIASRINVSGNGTLNIGCRPNRPLDASGNPKNMLTTAVVRLIE